MLFRGTTITFEAALRDLGSPDVRVRVAAADALGDAPEGEDRDAATRGLIGVAGDARFEVRRSVALGLGELGGEAAVTRLLELLEDRHPEVRQAAAIALGRVGDERGFAPLAEALRDGPVDLRSQAAVSLVEIDAERSYQPLLAAVGDADAEVRANVACALGAVGDHRAADALAGLLQDPAPSPRFESALALARLGDARALAPLTAALDGPADRVYAALEGLEALGDSAAAPALARLCRKIFAIRALRVRSAGVLLGLAPDSPDAAYARALLAKAARSWRAEVRGLAEEALARLEASP
jgi:HEAT repeat protein